MAAMKLPSPLYYSIDDLAHEWGCHPDRVRAFAASGLLEVKPVDFGDTTLPAVADEEKSRFESLLAPESMEGRPINRRDERNSLFNIIGALAFIAYAQDVTRPYALTRTIQEDAATLGIPLEIGEDTIADKLKDAFALMREYGCVHFEPKAEESELRAAPQLRTAIGGQCG